MKINIKVKHEGGLGLSNGNNHVVLFVGSEIIGVIKGVYQLQEGDNEIILLGKSVNEIKGYIRGELIK